jgi:hypothetical protein
MNAIEEWYVRYGHLFKTYNHAQIAYRDAQSQIKEEIVAFVDVLDMSKDGHFTKDFIVGKLQQLAAEKK